MERYRTTVVISGIKCFLRLHPGFNLDKTKFNGYFITYRRDGSVQEFSFADGGKLRYYSPDYFGQTEEAFFENLDSHLQNMIKDFMVGINVALLSDHEFLSSDSRVAVIEID